MDFFRYLGLCAYRRDGTAYAHNRDLSLEETTIFRERRKGKQDLVPYLIFSFFTLFIFIFLPFDFFIQITRIFIQELAYFRIVVRLCLLG